MSARIVYDPEAFYRRTGKSPRVHVLDWLDEIRALPCVVCGSRPVEAAHIRMAIRWAGKRETGKGEKPDDWWTLPLCPMCHRRQHSMSEAKFYADRSIRPGRVALALWAARGDQEKQIQVIQLARQTT